MKDGALEDEDYPKTLLVGVDKSEPSLNVEGDNWSKYNSNLPYTLSVNVKSVTRQDRDKICDLVPCFVTIDMDELGRLKDELDSAEDFVPGQMELTNPLPEDGQRDVMVEGNSTWFVLRSNPEIHPGLRPAHGWTDLLEQGFFPSNVAQQTRSVGVSESSPTLSPTRAGGLLKIAFAQRPLLRGRKSGIVALIQGKEKRGERFSGRIRRALGKTSGSRSQTE